MSLGVPGIDYTTALKRRVVRSAPNPQDKSTVVSIYPASIREVKHTIQPGVFEIPPGTYEKPALLVVGTSSWWREIDPEQPLLEIPIPSIQVADSIVKDYANGLFMCNMGDSMPGLFYVPGEIDHAKLLKDHKARLDDAANKQKTWFQNLVKAADISWSRTNGNPLAISDDMRLAARELKLENKPWMGDFVAATLDPCPACGQLYNSKFPVCLHCKTIVNKKLYDTLGLKQAV